MDEDYMHKYLHDENAALRAEVERLRVVVKELLTRLQAAQPTA